MSPVAVHVTVLTTSDSRKPPISAGGDSFVVVVLLTQPGLLCARTSANGVLVGRFTAKMTVPAFADLFGTQKMTSPSSAPGFASGDDSWLICATVLRTRISHSDSFCLATANVGRAATGLSGYDDGALREQLVYLVLRQRTSATGGGDHESCQQRDLVETLLVQERRIAAERGSIPHAAPCL